MMSLWPLRAARWRQVVLLLSNVSVGLSSRSFPHRLLLSNCSTTWRKEGQDLAHAARRTKTHWHENFYHHRHHWHFPPHNIKTHLRRQLNRYLKIPLSLITGLNDFRNRPFSWGWVDTKYTRCSSPVTNRCSFCLILKWTSVAERLIIYVC